jgi:hypothetical protein
MSPPSALVQSSSHPAHLLSSLAVVGAAALVPAVLMHHASAHLTSGNRFRAVWLAAFLFNCITVSVPGRFDGQMEDGKISVVWRSLFSPSGWAFAIWGVIYTSELFASVYIAARGGAGLRKASLFWLAGTLFQSLWCLVFRPYFKGAMWYPNIFSVSSMIRSFLCAGCHH